MTDLELAKYRLKQSQDLYKKALRKKNPRKWELRDLPKSIALWEARIKEITG